jgi:acyl-CoA synthetase (AMP-forming)/AMP-acid ligase II
MVAMAVGAAVAPPVTRFSADSWAALSELGTTHATLAPAMIERLLEAGTIPLPSLRTITYGSSPIRPATMARLLAEHPSIGLLQGYSQTEGGPITALTPEDHRRAAAHRHELLGSVGRAAGDTEVIIHRPDGDGIGEEVVAFIVSAGPGEPPDPGELRRFVRQELAGFKVPARWHVADELPGGALGKVLRRALRAKDSRPASTG